MDIGDLFQYKKEVLEVTAQCEIETCKYCYGYNKMPTCRKLPDCSGRYHRRLTPYEVRRAKKQKRIIHSLTD